MNLDLTATPIIVADGGGRVIYKNAAAKKLLPGCRKGTPLIRYLSAVGYDSYLQMRCDTIERHDIIVFDNTYSMCRNSLAGCYNYNGERRTCLLYTSRIFRFFKRSIVIAFFIKNTVVSILIVFIRCV